MNINNTNLYITCITISLSCQLHPEIGIILDIIYKIGSKNIVLNLISEICCSLYLDTFTLNKTLEFSGVNKNINSALNAEIIADSLVSTKISKIENKISKKATVMNGHIFSIFIFFIVCFSNNGIKIIDIINKINTRK